MNSNLTQNQFNLWLGQSLNRAAPLYNMPFVFALDGEVDPHTFERAFQHVIATSDAMRSVIVEENGEPQRRVRSSMPHGNIRLDLSQHDDADAQFQAWLDEFITRPFDLERVAFSSALVKLPNARTAWVLNQHHATTDAASARIIFQRTAEAYAILQSGRAANALARSYPSFEAYAARAEALRNTDAFARAQAHWRARLDVDVPRIQFFDRPFARRSSRSQRVTVSLGRERTHRLKSIASEREFRALSDEMSLLNVVTTLIVAYLHRISGHENIRLGLPFHNRATNDDKNTVGLFIEVCPLLFNVQPRDTFATLCKRVAREVLGGLKAVLPGVSTVESNGAFDVLLNFITARFEPFGDIASTAEWVHAGHSDAAHSLRLQVHDFNSTGALQLSFDFNCEVFDEAQRAQTIAQFLRLTDALIKDTAREINTVSLQSDDERERFVVAFNRTDTPRPADTTVLDLFAARAQETPNAVAIEHAGATLTYAELHARSNQLARRLIGMGLRPEQPVAIYMAHSREVVVAILGVLKAGGAYVPVDPSYPRERLNEIVADIASWPDRDEPPIVLAQTSLAPALGDLRARVIALDDAWHAPESSAEFMSLARPNQLAYVLFTSGSTGKPKGVEITHASLLNYAMWASDVYVNREPRDWALFTSLSFDLTVTSIFTPLITGGRILAFPERSGARGANLFDVIADGRAEVIKLTPAHVAMMSREDVRALRARVFIVGGEDFKTRLARDLVHAFGARAIAIYNEYGPTEATVGCMLHRFDEGRDVLASVPIGAPAANARILILDAHGNPTPTGAIGEMFIGGAGLARGYFMRSDLTAQRFVELDSCDSAIRGRFYRSGDLARWLPCGALEFLGRADQQVKLGGARIELGEIEARLLSHPHVRECVAIVETSPTPSPVAVVRHCARCGMPSNFPGIVFDDAGVCNLCRDFDAVRDKAQAYFRPMRDLELLAAKMKREAKGNHDCVALYSGGKDSTYMLFQLVALGLRPLAFTLDNGYISAYAKTNIQRVAAELGIEHIFGSTPHMNAIFVESLQRHANVCNGCFKTIYSLSAKLARERGIGYIVTGLSRGQFFETRLSNEVLASPSFSPDEIDTAVRNARAHYHRADDAVSRALDVDIFRSASAFDDVEFVDFYRYCDASLDEMYAFLQAHSAWTRPSDTGRSTNCLINDVGIYEHKRQRGYHNYALPYAWDVRLGHKTRDAALDELDDDIDEARVHQIMREIGYVEPRAAEPAPQRLIAYVAADAIVTESELREYLAKFLPDYLLPARIIRLDALPLTPNGKVDRNALPRADGGTVARSSPFIAPRNDTEARIAQIWARVLAIHEVSVDDDFFRIGGASLTALRIVARVNDEFGISLSLSNFLAHPTVADMASSVEAALIVQIAQLTDDEAERLLALA